MDVNEYLNSYKKNRKKELEEKRKTGGLTADEFMELHGIAPQPQEERTYFTKGAYEDGYQVGDFTKTALGTVGDVASNVGAGILGIGEKTIDAGAYILGGVGGVFGADKFKNNMQDFIKKDLYDEEKLSNAILFGAYSDTLDIDKYSVLGEKSDSLAQSGGQLLGTIGLQAVGVPWWVTTGVTSFGGEVESAFNQEATYGEAGVSGLITAGLEVGLEKLSGGISFGGKTLDEGLKHMLTSKIGNETAKTLAKLGFDAVGEGVEEVLTEIGSALGRKITYEDETTVKEILTSKEAWDNYLEAFIGGGVLGGAFNINKARNSIKTGRDYDTNLTQNEQSVLDKVAQQQIEQQERESGKKLTKKEQTAIKEDVENKLKRGEIDIDTISSTFGGDSYKAYESLKKESDEFNTLYKTQKGDLSREQEVRLEELEAKNKEKSYSDRLLEAQGKLSETVNKATENDMYLRESFAEEGRKGEVFKLSAEERKQFTAEEMKIVNKAIESGDINNTRKAHDMVSFVAKLSADLKTDFDFTNNKKLAEAGYTVEGKTIDGFKEGNKIAVNLQSKKALNTVVGHEITHVLEGTKLYDALQGTLKEYATSKGVYNSLFNTAKENYKNVYKGLTEAEYNKKIEQEVTADLVGEYIFSDTDFVRNLSTKNPNVFQKVFNEIKHMLKLVTAGSDAEKQLLKAKKIFEDVYRDTKRNTSEDVKFSIADTLDSELQAVLDNKFNSKKGEVHIGKTSQFLVDEIDAEPFEMLMPPNKAYSAMVTKEQAKAEGRYDKELNYHGFGKETLIEALTKAENPIATYVSDVTEDNSKKRESRIVLITEAKKDGNYIAVVNEVSGTGKLKGKRIEANITVTAFDKENIASALLKAKSEGRILSLDKKRSQLIASGEERQTLNSLNNSDFKKNIQNFWNNVNYKNGKNKQGETDKLTYTPFADAFAKGGIKLSVSDNATTDNMGNSVSIAMQKRLANTKAVDENGDLKVLYHGTPNGEFTIFDKSKGSVEGDFGSGFYFTDNESDVERNYEGGGPDFENKVSRRAEQIEAEEDIDYDEAVERAREELYVGSNKFEVYLNIENPAIVGETMLLEQDAYLEQYDESDFEDYDEYLAEVEQLVTDDIESIIWDIEQNIDLYGDTSGIANVLYEAYYEGGIDIADLKERINELYLEDSEGNMVGNEVTRQIIESLGYDGIIDSTVSSKFSNMGMSEDTTHYIVFKPNQIKSITNQNPTDNPDINLSLTDNNKSIAPTPNGIYGKDVMLERSIAPPVQNQSVETNNMIAPSVVPQTENEGYEVHASEPLPLPQVEEVRGVKMNAGQPPIAPRTTERGKLRSWAETSTESEVVNREILPEDLDQSKIYYEPISNKKTLDTANADLDRMGYDKALEVFNAKLENRTVSLSDIALGERLVQESLKRGDTKTTGELIQNIAILGTELGQKVQALSIIQRMTPEGQLKMLQKVVNRGKAKGDRVFDGVEITQEMIDKILSVYGKDGTYDQNRLNEAVEQVKQDIADQMSVTKMDKVNAWRYLAMLGNPKTHIRNIVSNITMQATTEIKDLVARTTETLAPIKNRTKTFKQATDVVKRFAEQSTAEAKAMLTSENSYSESADIKSKRDVFKTKILQKAYDFNNDLMTKEDWWFKKARYKKSLQEFLTANGIKTQEDINNNPELVEKGKKYATEQAQIATFQQTSWLANKINEIERKNVATQVGVGAILPFKKTPINIAKTGLAYSPLGFVKSLTYDLHQMKKGNIEASQVVDNLAKGVTGSALVYIGYMLAMSGLLNGGGEDDKEGKYDYQLGEQSYSLNFGGSTYSLNWLTPVAMPLFIGANAFEMLEEDKELSFDTTSEALAQTLDPLSEMSFLSSLDSVLTSYESGMGKFAGIGETMLQNYVTQFAPTLMSQVAQVTDDTKRSTTVAGDSDARIIEQTINKLKYKIPGLRQTLEPTIDIWGNEVKQTENVMARAFETFIAPYSRKDNIATEIDEEIKYLYSQTGDNGVIPNTPNKKVQFKGDTYKMSAKEYTDYRKVYGELANDTLEDLFKTSTYQNSDAEDKAELVNRVYKYASDEAKKDYLAKEGVEYTNTTEDNVPVYKTDKIKGAIENDMTLEEFDLYNRSTGKYYISKVIGGYDTYKAITKSLNEFESEKDILGKTISNSRKAKVVSYLNNLDADYYTKILMYKAEYPGDNTYNMEIINYLNEREDITRQEMIDILNELGFKVTADGRIRW